MTLVWRVIKFTALDFVEEVFWLVIFNLLWCISAILIIPLPFTTVAMAWVASQISQGKAIGWRTFVEGGRRYWKQAYLWGAVNLLMVGILFLNLSFYRNLSSTWAAIPYVAFMAISLWWIALQLYTFPFLFLQVEPDLKMAYRNGVLLLISRPLLTFTMFIMIAALTAASYFLTFPFFVVYFAFLALLANRCVVESMKAEEDDEDDEAEESRMPYGKPPTNFGRN